MFVRMCKTIWNTFLGEVTDDATCQSTLKFGVDRKRINGQTNWMFVPTSDGLVHLLDTPIYLCIFYSRILQEPKDENWEGEEHRQKFPCLHCDKRFTQKKKSQSTRAGAHPSVQFCL